MNSNQTYLIADSGGSGTDWCFVNEEGVKKFFKGKSYHPRHFNDSRVEEESLFWEDNAKMKNATVFFYGAGCGSAFEKEQMRKRFQGWGFDKIQIESDLDGACKALIGNKNGSLAILGTGSVLANCNRGLIVKLKGGWGAVLGDEGSGYYFGKLLLQAYLGNKFKSETQSQLAEILGEKDEIFKQVYGINGHSYISQLAQRTAHLYHLDEIKDVHYFNINTFLNQHFPMGEIDNTAHLIFVGSYAYYNQGIIRELMDQRGLVVKLFVQNPIKELTDYSINQSL
jgi:glucosamine kinase